MGMKARKASKGPTHLFVPDTQLRKGVPYNHIRWAARYAIDRCVDKVILAGDWWDMPSLSGYDSAQYKAARGITKRGDIDAGNKGAEVFQEELTKRGVNPAIYLTLGNHDGTNAHSRIGRHLAENPEDRGMLSRKDFAYSWLGWKTVDFLEHLEVDGVIYSHLFPYNLQGKTSGRSLRMGAASANVQVRAVGKSCTAGHKQGLDISICGSPIVGLSRGLIAGSYYLHDETYMGPGNHYWRGLIVKHDVRPGGNPQHYDLMEVSMEYLRNKYGRNEPMRVL